MIGFAKGNAKNLANENVTGSDIIAVSHTDVDTQTAMLQSVDSAPYGKKLIMKIKGLRSTRESNKIRTFPETTIYDMEYFITADLR